MKTLEENLNDLNTPLKDKYSSDIKILEDYLVNLLDETLISNIPEVIFWEHSSEYILEPNTSFKEILSKNEFNELPRPLMNVFRIGLNIHTFQELSDVINKIQTDGDERSKLMDKINHNLNSHIRNIFVNG